MYLISHRKVIQVTCLLLVLRKYVFILVLFFALVCVHIQLPD